MEFQIASDAKKQQAKKRLLDEKKHVGIYYLLISIKEEIDAYQKFRHEIKKLSDKITPEHKKNRHKVFVMKQGYLLQLLVLEFVIGIAQITLIFRSLDSITRLVTKDAFKGLENSFYELFYSASSVLIQPVRGLIHPFLQEIGVIGGRISEDMLIFASYRIWALESIYPLLALFFYLAFIKVMVRTIRVNLREIDT